MIFVRPVGAMRGAIAHPGPVYAGPVLATVQAGVTLPPSEVEER